MKYFTVFYFIHVTVNVTVTPLVQYFKLVLF